MKNPKEKPPLKGAVEQATMTVNVSVDDDGGSEPIYSNYAEVARSQYEIEVRFARAPTKMSSDQITAIKDGETISLYPLVKVILPFEVAAGLADAIKLQMSARDEAKNGQ